MDAAIRDGIDRLTTRANARAELADATKALEQLGNLTPADASAQPLTERPDADARTVHPATSGGILGLGAQARRADYAFEPDANADPAAVTAARERYENALDGARTAELGASTVHRRLSGSLGFMHKADPQRDPQRMLSEGISALQDTIQRTETGRGDPANIATALGQATDTASELGATTKYRPRHDQRHSYGFVEGERAPTELGF